MAEGSVQYETSELKTQLKTIAVSRLNALRKVIHNAYAYATGLTQESPPELWRFAISRAEGRLGHLRNDDVTKAAIEHVQRIDPQFQASPATHNKLVAKLKKVTLRNTVKSLTAKTRSDDELAKHLSTLLRLHAQGPIAPVDEVTKLLLIEHWLDDPLTSNWATASLCFFSDQAIAKMVHWLQYHRWLRLHQIETETERIRKIYHDDLGLVSAKPRIIRDVQRTSGKFHFIAFKAARHVRHAQS